MNLQGVTASIASLFKPAILLPRLIVPSISELDFTAFKAKGVNGIVIDKDNCITKPGNDQLQAELKPAWNEMLRIFGPANVLIVSNSAGTKKDPILLQAESVSRNMHVPVLIHSTPKPGYRSARGVIRYFNPPPKEKLGRLQRLMGIEELEKKDGGAVMWKGKERDISNFGSVDQGRQQAEELTLLVIGDRLATDMILSHRLNNSNLNSHKPLRKITTIPILTTKLHAREGLGTTFLRSLEKGALWAMKARIDDSEWKSCVKVPLEPLPASPLPSLSNRVSDYWHEYQSLPSFSWNWVKKWNSLFESLTRGTEEIMNKVEKQVLLKMK